MLDSIYAFEKMSEFKQKEMKKQSREWWKYDRTKNGNTAKYLFSLTLKFFDNK